MSDPAKDAAIRRDRNKRRSVYDNYRPIVLWVKTKYPIKTGDGAVDPIEMVRLRIRDDAKDIFNVQVASSNEPYIQNVVTEFDDGVFHREEEAVEEFKEISDND